MRIAVDMDEVLADTHAAKLALYRDRFGYDWSAAETEGRKLADLARPDHAAWVEAHLQAGVFFANLPVIEDAVDALRDLAQAHEVIIATAALEYPASCAHKVAWMAQHFPFIDPLNIVFCGHKHVIAADLLIDDHSRHFPRFQGQGVLFSAPHNAADPHPVRLDRWADAGDLVASLATGAAA